MLSFALKFSGYLATSLFLTQLEDSTKHDCIKACYYNTNCSSFFFNIGTGLCQLEKAVYGNTNSLSAVDNVLFFAVKQEITAGCPTDYTYYRNTNQCLKLYSVKKTFLNAKVTCEDDSGHLVYPNTAERNAQVAAMKETVWIGGHKVAPDEWEWLDGLSVGPYTNWAHGQPGQHEDAICAQSQGEWHDYSSHKTLSFICEFDVGEVPALGC